jgi:hypothetical protein
MTNRNALAEVAAAYGGDAGGTRHVKLSISLPADLVAQLRTAAEQTDVGVSGVVAAAIRQALAAEEQSRIDRALELDAEDNAAWAADALALTARAWASLEW